ncbi:MAG: NUDIX hydrolase [Acidimicrobiales bacterium]
MARVVLIDRLGAVLLISARDPRRPGGPEVWFTPGGGAEPGETLESAARREVLEETGAVLSEVGAPVCRSESEFWFEDRYFVQHECYFLVRTERFDVCPTALTDLETRATTGWRWWPAAELATTSAQVYPATFPALLAEWTGSSDGGARRRLGSG